MGITEGGCYETEVTKSANLFDKFKDISGNSTIIFCIIIMLGVLMFLLYQMYKIKSSYDLLEAECISFTPIMRREQVKMNDGKIHEVEKVRGYNTEFDVNINGQQLRIESEVSAVLFFRPKVGSTKIFIRKGSTKNVVSMFQFRIYICSAMLIGAMLIGMIVNILLK